MFQGHISGKRTEGVKSNPIYHDKQKSADSADVTANDYNITVYNSFPLKRQRNVDIGEPPYLPSGEENPNYSSNSEITNSTRKEEMQHENLKVSRVGDVVVGDIIIETDYKNISLNEEDVISELEKMAKGENLCENLSDNNNVENLNQKEKATLLKQELEEIKLENLQGENENERKHLWNGHNGKPAKMNGNLNHKENSDWPNIDDLVVSNGTGSNNTGQCECQKSSETESLKEKNESLPHEKMNGVVSNGKTDSNGLHVNGKIPNGSVQHNVIVSQLVEEEESKKSKKSKKNSSKKKVRERKNSLPDHILNSLSMKPKKPILVPALSDATTSSCSDANRTNSSITEQKSVKFSKDTVFNDNKPNKYRKEKVKDPTRNNGTVNSNPVFVDDNGFEISLTDDEKVLHFSNNSDTNSQVRPWFDVIYKRYL